MKRILSKFKSSIRHLTLSTKVNASKPSQPREPNGDGLLPAHVQSERPPSVIPEAEGSEPNSAHSDILSNSSLENLPPELRLHLLSVLELGDLKALVHASPVYHQQYLVDRKHILYRCLETTLRSTAVDAYAAYQSGLPEFAAARNREKVMQCLQDYRYRRSSPKSFDLNETLTLDEIVGMVCFHFNIALPLLKYYVSWAFDDISKQTEKLQNPEPLSRTEETRLMRAFYRFQLCCNLFGVGWHETPRLLSLDFESFDILNIFFRLFEPWEVEEIVCIYCLAQETYSNIFDRISWDVNEKNPKFDGQRPPTPDGAFDLGNSWIRDSLLKGTISRGLVLLHAVLFQVKTHAQLVSTMQEHIEWPVGHFLGNEAMGETAQTLRRQRYPSTRDLKQERRDELPFLGDDLLDTEKGSPPFAWTLVWGGTYSNLYGYYSHDMVRRWGYVMWDAARLKHTGASEVLRRQWEARWGDFDPRDNL